MERNKTLLQYIIHSCYSHYLVIIFVLLDILDHVCTVRGIAFAEWCTTKAISVATTLARTACLTCTFCKFDHSSRGRHFDASHRHVDTFLQLPTIFFNSRKLWAVGHIRFVTHGNVIRSYNMGQQCSASRRQHFSFQVFGAEQLPSDCW